MSTHLLAEARVEFAERPWAITPAALAAIDSELRRYAGPVEVPERTATPVRRVAVPDRQKQRGGGAVAIIPLQGVITPRSSLLARLFGMGGGLEQFRADLRTALDDDEVSSIVLDVDSPGGLVDLVPETADEIRSAREQKPIVAVANTRAASAAYWLAAQATELVGSPSSEVGSVGVYLRHVDWSGFNDAQGIAPTYVSAGKFKTEANPDEPLSDDAQGHLQALVDESYDQFVQGIADGRGVSAADVRNGYGEGRVLSASRALDAGMVDRVATLEQVVAELVGSGGEVRELADEAPSDEDLLDEEARSLLGAAARQAPQVRRQASTGDDVPEPIPAALPAWLELARPGH